MRQRLAKIFFLAPVEDVEGDGVVLVGAEEDAGRGVVVRACDLAVVVVHIELYLADLGCEIEAQWASVFQPRVVSTLGQMTQPPRTHRANANGVESIST